MTRAEQHRVRIRTLLLIGSLGLIGALKGSTLSRQTMRGSVVAVADNEAQICIGSHDGLKVGDALAVYRTRQAGFPTLPYGPNRSPGEWERSTTNIVFAAAFVLSAAGCSVSHETMRGSVVTAFEKQAPLTKEAIVPDRSGGYRPKLRFEKVKIGQARVIEILSEQHAAIELVEGELQTNDIVEKTRRP